MKIVSTSQPGSQSSASRVRIRPGAAHRRYAGMRPRTGALWGGTLALAALLVTSSCVATPPAPPQELADRLVAMLDQGDRKGAHVLFDEVEDRGEYRDQVYPRLYTAARERYRKGELEEAARYLRFLAQEYPDATAARQALLYCLFLQRAADSPASQELTQECGELLDDLRGHDVDGAQWLALVATQNAIDRGDVDEARLSFDTFLEAWNGRPEELWLYVDDVDRFLASH